MISTWLKALRNRWFGIRGSRPALADRRRVRRVRMTVEALEERIQPSANPFVITDLPDYSPGSTAIFNAGNFLPGETLDFHVARTDGVPIESPPAVVDWSVLDGGPDDLDGVVDGNIQTTWYVDSQFLNASLQLTATGESSALRADTTFTDSGTPDLVSGSDSGSSPTD